MLNYDEFVNEMSDATATINRSAGGESDLLATVCEEVADRLSLYLNIEPDEDGTYWFDARLVKIGARISSGIFTETLANIAGNAVDTQIKSISDNGQSVTYGDMARSYLNTVSDGEIFGGCVELLKPFRRCNVVS